LIRQELINQFLSKKNSAFWMPRSGVNPNKNRQTKSVVVGVVAILSAVKVSAISVRNSVGQFWRQIWLVSAFNPNKKIDRFDRQNFCRRHYKSRSEINLTPTFSKPIINRFWSGLLHILGWLWYKNPKKIYFRFFEFFWS
jgi:hypothetical protein